MMSDKVKVKVIKSSHYIEGYGGYEDNAFNILYPVSTDWEEVIPIEREEIAEAVRYANHQRTQNGEHYVMLEYNDDIRNEVFDLASKFKEKMEKEKARDEARKEEAARKRLEKAEERKRKQFEKLKKELGEE